MVYYIYIYIYYTIRVYNLLWPLCCEIPVKASMKMFKYASPVLGHVLLRCPFACQPALLLDVVIVMPFSCEAESR